MPRVNDLTGLRFGKLTVIEATDKRMDQGSVVWRCRCDCGNEKDVSARRLQRGKAKSCGCLSDTAPADLVGQRFGRLTVTEFAGRVRGSGTRSLWKCRCDCGKETIVSQSELRTGDTKSCGCLQKERACEALKIVGDTSVTLLERNMQTLRSSNTSGCTGVSQGKDGRWTAYISFRKKRYWLGRYDRKEDAIRARKRGEEMHEDFLNWYYENYTPIHGRTADKPLPKEA